MRIFLDTDILLDVYLERTPHAASSGELLNWAEINPGKSAISWHGLANLHYLSKNGAEGFIRELIVFCEVPATGSAEMMQALELGFKDFEDGMQTAAALKFNAQVIATRNIRDFQKSPIAVQTPDRLLQQWL